MVRAVYALLVGLVGAGIVHIAILFLLPSISERDAWSVLASGADPYEVLQVASEGPTAGVARDLDPLFAAVACRFDLADGPLHVTANGRVPFWSMSLYDNGGQNVFSLADRTAADGRLDVAIVDPLQMLELRNAMPPGAERALFVETGITEGIVLVRAFVPDPSWEPGVGAYLRGVDCRPF